MRRRLLWVSVVVMAAVGYLAYTGWQGAATYYLTPAEAAGRDMSGRTFRVAGTVGEGVAWDAGERVLRFEVTDGTGRVAVVYRGAPPDNFAAGQQVVVEGVGEGRGSMTASRIIMKCPGKYEQAPSQAGGRSALYLGGAGVVAALVLALAVSRRLGTEAAGRRAGRPA